MSDTHAPDSGTLAALARPEQRLDSAMKVTGRAKYVADLSMPGTLRAAFLLSPYPHARIVSVSTDRARSIPGVHGVLTGADVVGSRYGRRLQDRPVLAWDRVRFVGDRVAAVAAETEEAAAAAVAAIEVEYEELAPILDTQSALADGAPILHPDASEYEYFEGARPPVPHPNVQGHVLISRGSDLDAAFETAAHVVERTYRTPRQHSVPLEPHATLVWVSDDERIHVATTNKTPFPLRRQLSSAFDLPPERFVVEASYIGGDFGGKGYSVDEFACVALALATKRPIRSVSSYAAELGEFNTRHAATMHVRTACDSEGFLTAHAARIELDGGAYAAAKPLPHLTLAGATATLAGYVVPNVLIEVLSIYTNTVPGGHVRSPGEVQALFAGESSLDELARVRGEDPLAFRLRNAVRQGAVGAAGQCYREARAVEVLEAAADGIAWTDSRPPGKGVGLAMSARHVGSGKLPLRLQLRPDGQIELFTGLPEQGSGGWQVIRRSLAVSAGIDEQRVLVTHVATDQTPFDPGVGGSRVTHIASRAAQQLGLELREWVLERLPKAIPTATHDAELVNDRIVDRAKSTSFGTFGEVASRLLRPGEVVELTTTFESEVHPPEEGGDYDFAACAVEVAVDRDTGRISVEDALIAVDVGTVINPVGHRGQLEGGFIFGLSQATMEELGAQDGIISPLSLADLKIPTVGDIPPLRIVHIPTSTGPGAFGAKMAGELTNAPVAPAIANAIADAVGVRLTELPLSAEQVFRALRNR